MKRMAADAIHLILHRKIRDGQLEAFKDMARHFATDIEANEPGTVSYEYYVSGDGTESYVAILFSNSEAFLQHDSRARASTYEAPDVGPMLDALVLGSPNAQAREALTWLKPKYLPFLVGYTR